MRTAVARWGEVHRLIRQLDAIVQLHAALDTRLRRGHPMRRAAEQADADLRTLERQLQRASLTVQLEAADTYLKERLAREISSRARPAV